ncbi:hypothetical protein KKA13_01120 [Patescibacteria group bacterium]|nr:hypothetical protein [Patescibacteria group bacterium]
MQTKTLGKIIFFIGILTMFVYSAFSFLWALSGIPLPYPLAGESDLFGLFALMTPPIGALLMVIGGLIYGKKIKKTII